MTALFRFVATRIVGLFQSSGMESRGDAGVSLQEKRDTDVVCTCNIVIHVVEHKVNQPTAKPTKKLNPAQQLLSLEDPSQVCREAVRMAEAKGYEEWPSFEWLTLPRNHTHGVLFHPWGTSYDDTSDVLGTGKTMADAYVDAIRRIYRKEIS